MQFVGQGLRECDHTGLDRVVRTHHRGVDQAGRRGGVDDVTRPLTFDHRGERAATANHAHQVDVDHAVPLVERLDVDAAAGRYAGVVHQDVEAAAPVLLAPLDRRGPVGCVADVQL